MHVKSINLNSLIDRIDANFYVSRAEVIEGFDKEYNVLGRICDFPRAKTPPRELYFKSGVPVIKLKNVTEYFLQLKDTDYLPEDNYKLYVQPKVGDILVTATGEGTIGRVGIFEKDIKCIVTGEVMIIRTKEENPYFLFAYLRSPHCRYQLEKYARGSTGQTHLYSKDVSLIPILKVSKDIRDKTEKLVKEAIQKKLLADDRYKEAETKLCKTLGIDKININFNKSFEASSKDVMAVMRFDSEYFQPKYRKIIELLRRSNLKVNLLKDCVLPKNRRVDPRKDPSNNFIYIEIGDIDITNGEIYYKKIYGYEAPPNARKRVKTGDILLSKVRPTRGAITIIPDNLDDAVSSSAFYICRPREDFLSEFLFLYLRSDLALTQFGQPIAGSMYPTIKDEGVENILVPVIPKKEQTQIANLIKEYFILCKESRLLLDKASSSLFLSLRLEEKR